VGYVLIPAKGGFPSVLSSREAQSRISDNQDHEKASRFSELLSQRGAADVPFWFAGSDVIIRGTMDTAWTISNLVEHLPSVVPSAQADNDNNVAGLAQKAHIASAFADAVNPLGSAPDMGASFTDAAAYARITGRRLPSFGYSRLEV
jgi:hypothetical protein